VRPHFLGVTECNRANCGQFQLHMARDRPCHLSGTLPVAPKLPGIVSGGGTKQERVWWIEPAIHPTPFSIPWSSYRMTRLVYATG